MLEVLATPTHVLRVRHTVAHLKQQGLHDRANGCTSRLSFKSSATHRSQPTRLRWCANQLRRSQEFEPSEVQMSSEPVARAARTMLSLNLWSYILRPWLSFGADHDGICIRSTFETTLQMRWHVWYSEIIALLKKVGHCFNSKSNGVRMCAPLRW